MRAGPDRFLVLDAVFQHVLLGGNMLIFFENANKMAKVAEAAFCAGLIHGHTLT